LSTALPATVFASFSWLAPARADPQALSPHPPSGRPNVVELWVGHHLFWSVVNQPSVPSMEIGFIHRAVSVVRHTIRIGL
jgi:hypothetical protein